MSYSINIVKRKNGETVQFKTKHDIHGGTYCIGGTTEAGIDITYNYSRYFYTLWPESPDKPKKDGHSQFDQMFAGNDGGIRSLYGKPLDDVINELDIAVKTLKGDPDEDYWKPTEGNARKALFDLKLLCERARYENPEADLTLHGD